MLSYKKTFKLLDQKGIKTYKIIPGGKEFARMQNNGYITTRTIDKLCAALDCQPGDLMEYVPESTGTGSAGEPEEEKQ